MDDRKKNLNKITLLFWATLISSIISSPLFGKLYLFIFKPLLIGGLGGVEHEIMPIIIQNSIFAIPFFLPLFISVFVPKKQLLAWSFFVSVPFLLFLIGGGKHLLWFFIFTVSGCLIGWLIKFIIEKFKKNIFKK